MGLLLYDECGQGSGDGCHARRAKWLYCDRQAGNALSDNNLNTGDWGGTFLYETQSYAPRLVSRTTSQEQKAYKTSYVNYDSYNNPGVISELGGGEAINTGNFCYLNPGNSNGQQAAC